MSAPPLPAGIANSGKLIIWNNSDGNGAVSLWDQVSPPYYTRYTCGPYPGWSALAVAAGSDQVPRILWTNADGRMSLWSVDGSGGFTHADYGPYTGYTAVGLAVGGDNAPRVLWAKTDGTMSLWRVAPDTTFTHAEYGPFPGYTASLIAAGADSIPRILWTKSDGSISLWHDVTTTADFAHAEYGPYSGYTAMSMAVDGNNTPRILWNHPSDGTTSLWSVAPSGSFTFQNATLPASYVPVAVGTGLDAGSGGYAQVLYVQAGTTGSNANINSFAPDGSSRLSSYAGPYAGDGIVLSAAGAGTGGGGTTVTPNPHGHYNVTYSGGTLTSSDGATCQPQNVPTISGPTTTTDSNFVSTYSGNAQFSGFYSTTTTASAKLGGSNASPTPITATFTWAPDSPGSPPPANVTVVQMCTVSWSAQYYINRTSGQCSTGLGQVSGTASGVPGNTVSGITTVSGGGPTFTVKCSPTAEVDAAGVGPNGTGTETLQTGTVSFSYTASAVTMNVAGTTPDPSGGDDLLTGQQCSATLKGVPAYPTTYAWSVSAGGGAPGSADVFYNYDPFDPKFHQLTLLSDAPSYTTGTGFSFYDKSQETIVIQCKVTISAADGKSSQVVTVQSQPISVIKPSVTTWGIETGFVQHVTSAASGQSGYQLHPDPNLTPIYPGGEYWHDIAINVPKPFSGGQGCLAQLITPSTITYQDGQPPKSNTNDGKQGLDNVFPYTSWVLPALGKESDSPTALVSNLNANGYQGYNTVSVDDNFTTWVMYIPPTVGSQKSVYVPIQDYLWEWSFTTKWLSSMWTLTSSSPASAATAPHYTGHKTNVPPTWPLVQNN